MLFQKCKGFNYRISTCFTGGQTDSREGQNEQITAYGKAECEAKGLWVGTRAYTCPKRVEPATKEAKRKFEFAFASCTSQATHFLSLLLKIGKKVT